MMAVLGVFLAAYLHLDRIPRGIAEFLHKDSVLEFSGEDGARAYDDDDIQVVQDPGMFVFNRPRKNAEETGRLSF